MTFTVILGLGWLSPVAASAQDDAGAPCYAFVAGEMRERLELEPSAAVVDAVAEILALHSLNPERVEVWASDVENAAAMVCGDRQKILYNPQVFFDLRAGSGWAPRMILAHELGHLLNDHPRVRDESRQRLELEADEFAGGVACRLGATLDQAQRLFERVGVGEASAGYPRLSERMAAVAAGWTRALDAGDCAESARAGLPDVRLFPDLEGTLIVDEENAGILAERPILSAARVHFETLEFVADHPLIVFAERISFEPAATVRGPDLALIAQTIEGGTLDASGALGENGGKILVAAGRLSGTSLVARGGPGQPGEPGEPGTDGRDGANGRDGRCGPGVLGEFVGSSRGGDGQDGGHGTPGSPGGNGGSGGRIILLTHERTASFTDVDGGRGGTGGDGGPGGRRGRGGRGGSGCQGLGGHQPTRPDGADGRPGLPGNRGLDGEPGAVGQVWTRALEEADELKGLLGPGGRWADDLRSAVDGIERLFVRSR